ncbi:MAG: phosphoadenylylsulfate reductase [Gammaproteobacteria bacterium]|nr:phosphoadenylylsulfate reductase [Gammaproteobacteria bacterium]
MSTPKPVDNIPVLRDRQEAVLPAGLEQPEDIIAWALDRAERPILSTNFRPHTAAILHLVTRACPGIPVIWVDSGYNTPATYRYAEEITRQLALNLQVYMPKVSVARRTAVFGGVPGLTDPRHAEFTREVKLEPFERALREWKPDVWFTGIRAEQNDFRRSLGVVSRGPSGTLKVAPLHHWPSVDLENHIHRYQLPDNSDYVDPTKGEDRLECGLQFLGSGI